MTQPGPTPRSSRPLRHVRRLGAALAAVCCATAVNGVASSAGAAPTPLSPEAVSQVGQQARHRTVVTTDMEQDDLASLIRYLFYTNDLDTEGIVYTSSKFHFAGDGKGTPFFLPGREYTTPQTSWRWTGTRTIQDIALKAYAQVYPNLRTHDRAYPTPGELLSQVKVGNIDFEEIGRAHV